MLVVCVLGGGFLYFCLASELIYLFKHSVCMTVILCAPACTLLVSFGLFVPALGESGSRRGGVVVFCLARSVLAVSLILPSFFFYPQCLLICFSSPLLCECVCVCMCEKDNQSLYECD